MQGYKLFGTATAAATGLGLLLGNAVAGSNNDAYVTQQGSYNQANIEQSGTGNQAGSPTLNIRQQRWQGTGSAGRYNSLTILQSGNNNEVGLEANTNPGAAQNGISQYMPSNSTGSPNLNVIEISQTSDGNVVGAIYQDNATHRQGDNRISILQADTGGHRVGSILQYRGNSSGTNFVAPTRVNVEQYGQGNTVERILQRTQVITPSAADEYANSISVRFEAGSSSNGNAAWTSGGAAAASGALSSTLLQGAETGMSKAYGNKIEVNIGGGNNQFGVSQLVLNDEAIGNNANIGISGQRNELGVYQRGNGNTLVASITLDENNYGVKQSGEYNSANLTVSGTGNGKPGFSGLAATVSLAPGLLVQTGLSNDVSLTVTGDNNAFASLQSGNGNGITAGQNGNGNQAAVSQSGNANSATLTQNGNGNNAAIVQ